MFVCVCKVGMCAIVVVFNVSCDLCNTCPLQPDSDTMKVMKVKQN